MALIFDVGMRAYPPRLPEQPIFYPVLNQEYAIQIACDWNTKEPDGVGYVTAFIVPDTLSKKYKRKVVGGSKHEEWWVPAEELDEFNRNIQGHITVEAAFFSQSFEGFISDQTNLKGMNAKSQLSSLAKHLVYSSFDVWCEIYVNRKAVFLNYLYWKQLKPEIINISQDEKNKIISFIEHRWRESDIDFTLPMN